MTEIETAETGSPKAPAGNGIRHVWRGQAVTTLAAACLVVAACGSSGAEPADGRAELAPNPTEAPATGTEEVSTQPTTSAGISDTASSTAPIHSPDTAPSRPASTDGSEPEDDQVNSNECRMIEHVMGTACVPASPQRILALDPLTVLPTLIAVGAPVATTVSVFEFGDPFVDYLDPADTDGIELVGSFQAEPNLEAIAAARPDLIIGSVSRLADHYDTLSKIAPTVVTGYAFYETNWRDEILLTADAVGHRPAAEELLAQLDEHIVETNAVLTADGAHPTLSRVDVWQGTPLYYQFECVWFGTLLVGAGVSQPPDQVIECTQGDVPTIIGYLSLETMDLLDADAIVAYQQQATEQDVGGDPTIALAASPLWASMSAVQSGNVFVLGDAWGIGGSVQAAHQILDDLTETVFAQS